MLRDLNFLNLSLDSKAESLSGLILINECFQLLDSAAQLRYGFKHFLFGPVSGPSNENVVICRPTPIETNVKFSNSETSIGP